MQITQTISWPPINWPSTTPATQYSILQVYPAPTPPATVNIITTVNTTSAQLTYDDAANLVYQVRPTSGTAPSLTYGPEAGCFVVGYVSCRGWLRNEIRVALADPTDSSTANANWPDSELNRYINDALTELNQQFPLEEETTITLQAGGIPNVLQSGVRDYNLPSDFYKVVSICYITADGKLHLFLKEKPFIGGESTAVSYLGYPKLGILLSPLAGRYYPGHYDVYNNQLHIDWDPAGDGDYLDMRYLGRRPFPANDADIMNVVTDDMPLLSLYAQMLAWIRVESQDTRLSRWRTRDDGSRRDDLPTVRHSSVIRSLYNEAVNDRRSRRPRVQRLVRR